MNENAGAYQEAHNRIREKREQEKQIVNTLTENFEKEKEKFRKRNGLEVSHLRNRLESSRSLTLLKDDIEKALREGTISRDAYDRLVQNIEQKTENSMQDGDIDLGHIPFSQNALAQFLESSKLGENIPVDIIGFFYGFFVQGSAILVILAWRILMDFLRLPHDVYKTLTHNNS